MHIILATEIWGRTSHVNQMVTEFEKYSTAVTVVDPYDGIDPAFTSENAAYARFVKECGHTLFAERVSQVLLSSTAPTCLVGFSAGAGAVWSSICAENVGLAKGAVCLYGSSIRNMTEFDPKVPVELIFPEHEPHFSVREVVRALRNIRMATCHTTPFGHGFMNPLSKNYNEDAYHLWLQWIIEKITLFSTIQT